MSELDQLSTNFKPYDVLIRPIVSEKSLDMSHHG